MLPWTVLLYRGEGVKNDLSNMLGTPLELYIGCKSRKFTFGGEANQRNHSNAEKEATNKG